MTESRVIVADCDRSLIRTDLLWEGLFLLFRERPWLVLIVPFWLLRRGMAGLKTEIADRVTPDPALLPYNLAVIDFLEQARREGHELILASASEQRWVDSVGQHLGLFDKVIGTTGRQNVKGRNKLAVLQDLLQGRPFSYIGDCVADLPLWNASQIAYVVGGSETLCRRIELPADRIERFPISGRRRPFLKALRLHQWSKNLLLFVPLLLSHQFMVSDKIFDTMLSFLVLSLAASAFYIVNDMLDIAADRRHPTKKNRPFAAGTISISAGVVLFTICFLTSIIVAFLFMSTWFLVVVLSYCCLTFGYSVVLKRKLILDVILLAFLYTLRIFAGGLAADVEVSAWLLTFSTFFFLCLAFVKRYIELHELAETDGLKTQGRNYNADDIGLVQSSGISSGFMSVLVFFIYIADNPKVGELYTDPIYLWFIGPLLIYWLLRIWFLAQRGAVESDPVLFAVKDRISWIMALLVVLFIILGARL